MIGHSFVAEVAYTVVMAVARIRLRIHPAEASRMTGEELMSMMPEWIEMGLGVEDMVDAFRQCPVAPVIRERTWWLTIASTPRHGGSLMSMAWSMGCDLASSTSVAFLFCVLHWRGAQELQEWVRTWMTSPRST